MVEEEEEEEEVEEEEEEVVYLQARLKTAAASGEVIRIQSKEWSGDGKEEV